MTNQFVNDMKKNFTKTCFTILGLLLFVYVNAQKRANFEATPSGSFKIQGVIGHPSIKIPEQKSQVTMAIDIPADQVKKECLFFGGDSLNGFDFDKASKQAELEGDNMYGEFRVFMFREQAKFVKKKYNIAMLPYEIEEEKMKIKPVHVLAGTCNNLDLETGDFTGWVGGSGVNKNSNAPLTVYGTAYYSNDQSIYDCNDLEIISSAYGNDPKGNFSGLDPNGGNYSSRIGGRDINKAYGFSGCNSPAYLRWNNTPPQPDPGNSNNGYHWSSSATGYSNGEYIEQTFVVTAANALLSYDYAVVLNDGGATHPDGQQPYFHVEIMNTSDVVLSPCTQYSVQATGGALPPGFLSATADNGPVYYKKWTSNSVNLTNYIGQTVVARFTTAGCTQGGHFGYAYIDATCGPAQVLTSNSSPCTGSNVTLTAPAVSGGTYSWSGPGIVGSTTNQTVTVNVSGTYSVTITPSQGGSACAYTLSIAVTFSSSSSSISSSTNVSCNGGGNGSATVNTSGANYSWSPSGGNGQTANNLAPGNYTVTVTKGGCISTATVAITQPSALTNTVSSSSNVSCKGGSNGSATVSASGGTPNYTYAWVPSGGNASTANNLSAGNYTVTVTDLNGCKKATAIAITQPTTALSNSVSSTQAGCTVANGTATANPSGGTGVYTYAWSPSGGNSQTANNLAAGIYTVTLTDANGCSSQTSVNILVTGNPTATASSNQAAGCTVANGTATANPSGGTGAYTYSWSPSGGNGQTANNLAAGNYTVVVTDANGCSTLASVAVPITSNIPSTTASPVSNVSCLGLSNGSASATPSGGTPNYTYAWSPTGGNGQTANNLAAGNYSVIVTDANGCTASAVATISQPTAAVTAVYTPTNVLCNGDKTGKAIVTPSGGTPNYTYAWSPSGGNSATANNLGAGSYQCTVTDANGCSKVISITITEPTVLAASTTHVDVTCNTFTNGSATATITGGTLNYTYTWIPSGGNSATANNLAAGTYTVSVKDANGCPKTAVVTINQPTPIVLSVSGKDSICLGGSTNLTANVSGGTPAYTCTWNPGGSGTSITVSPTTNTNYSVTITDGNHCASVTQVYPVKILPVPNALFDTASSGYYASTYAFADLSTPSVTITAWNWNFGDGSPNSTAQNPIHTFPGAGTYTVIETAYNKFGCPDTFSILVKVGEGIIIPNVFTPDGDGINDVWFIPNSGMKDFHVEIFDRWGAKVFETSADEIRWDGRSSSGKQLTDGTYFYILKAILKSGTGSKDFSTTGYVTLFSNKK